MDINFEVLSCPWKRCWKMLQDGEADLGLSVSNKLDRKKYVYFPENSVWSADFYFFATKETKEKYHLSSIEDARKNKLKVGIVRGNSYHESFWKVFPRDENNYNNQLSPTANALMNFRKLSKGRIDLFPIPKTIGLFTIKSQPELKNITYYDFKIFSKDYPVAFSKKSKFKSEKYASIEEVLKAYDQELKKFKETKEFTDIFLKYEK